MLQRRYQTMGFRVDDPWERALPAGDTLVAYDPLAIPQMRKLLPGEARHKVVAQLPQHIDEDIRGSGGQAAAR